MVNTIKPEYLESKGQVTIVNLLALLITLIFYIVFVPILNPMLDDLVISLNASPNEFTAATILLIRIVPFVLLLTIILSAVNYVMPRREGQLG